MGGNKWIKETVGATSAAARIYRHWRPAGCNRPNPEGGASRGRTSGRRSPFGAWGLVELARKGSECAFEPQEAHRSAVPTSLNRSSRRHQRRRHRDTALSERGEGGNACESWEKIRAGGWRTGAGPPWPYVLLNQLNVCTRNATGDRGDQATTRKR